MSGAWADGRLVVFFRGVNSATGGFAGGALTNRAWIYSPGRLVPTGLVGGLLRRT
jgi:hypothetical protein